MREWNQELRTLLNRDDLPRWLSNRYPLGTMVEIGTYYGDFATKILEGWSGRLMCVDPWSDQPDEEYRDGCANGGVAGGRNPMGPIFEQASRSLAKFGKRVRLIQDFSHNAVQLFPDSSLECVYVDGNHEYRHAIEDLTSWWNKLKPGGLIGIHDCYLRDDAVQRCGVWDAVWRFSFTISQQAFLTNCSSSWWIKE